MASSSPSEFIARKRKYSEDKTEKTHSNHGRCTNDSHQLELDNSNRKENINNTIMHEKKLKVQLESPAFHSVNYPPYLLSTVMGIDDMYNKRNVAVDLETILSKNCDSLIETVQFNYCFDIKWLLSKYPKSARNKPILLVHGFTGSEKLTFEGEAMNYQNIDLVHAKLPIPYGTHHSKMMFLSYSIGFKVVITTANLVESDWFQKTQGIWISPMFPLKSSTYCEEKDIFKKDLIEYLAAYKSLKLSQWLTKIHDYDMSDAKVRIIASVPGRHTKTDMNRWGHHKLRDVLSETGPDKSFVTKDWPVIGQFSSIGSLGEDSAGWLCSEWLRSLSCCKGDRFTLDSGKADNLLSLIFPTAQNVRDSLEGYSAGGSLCYSVQLATKQRYLKEHLCQWVASNTGRSLASPHIKSYARISPDSKSCAWFLLTSANLSKAAWGAYEKHQSQLMIRSYEIGVLFLPEEDGVDEEHFFNLDPYQAGTNQKSLQLPYDVPLTPYSSTDKPWVWDIKYTTEDSNGQMWIPS